MQCSLTVKTPPKMFRKLLDHEKLLLRLQMRGDASVQLLDRLLTYR